MKSILVTSKYNPVNDLDNLVALGYMPIYMNMSFHSKVEGHIDAGALLEGVSNAIAKKCIRYLLGKIQAFSLNGHTKVAVEHIEMGIPLDLHSDLVKHIDNAYPNMDIVAITSSPLIAMECLIEGEYRNWNASLAMMDGFNVQCLTASRFQQKIDSYYKRLLSGESPSYLESLSAELTRTYTGITIPDFKYLEYLKLMEELGIDVYKPKAHTQLTEEQKEELKKLL